MRKACLHPRFVRVKPFGEKRTKVFKVPCGKCIHCFHNHQRDWMFRMLIENQSSSEKGLRSYFVTLTLNDDFVNRGINKFDLQSFIRALRQKLNRDLKLSVNITYYAVGEYGKKTNRPHYHLMLFNMPNFSAIMTRVLIESIWKYGFVSVEDCVPKTIGYVSKYITKLDPREHEVEPFCITELQTSTWPYVFC